MPIALHELQIQRDWDAHSEILQEIPYKLSSSLVERIAIDEVVKSTPTDGSSIGKCTPRFFVIIRSGSTKSGLCRITTSYCIAY